MDRPSASPVAIGRRDFYDLLRATQGTIKEFFDSSNAVDVPRLFVLCYAVQNLEIGIEPRVHQFSKALLCLERQLRADGNTGAADDLYRQLTVLAGVAEAWRHPDGDRSRRLEAASAR